jgi:hypothetical protein
MTDDINTTEAIDNSNSPQPSMSYDQQPKNETHNFNGGVFVERFGDEADTSTDDTASAEERVVIVAGEEVPLQGEHLSKPSWCNAENWVEFRRKYRKPDMTYRCEITMNRWIEEGRPFEYTDLPLAETVDHIIPQAKGGRHNYNNLQPASWKENQRKSVKDDPSWLKRGFFDQALNLGSLRASQSDAGYDQIRAHHDIWANRMHELSSKNVILLLAWVVRSGKLFGGVTTAFGINHCIIEEHGSASKRIRRILILTKDETVRSQYAAELGGRLIKGKKTTGKWEDLGITAVPPKVLEATEGHQLKDLRGVSEYDIVVACSPMIWPKKGQEFSGDEFSMVMSAYDLIIVDEPHYATDQAEDLSGKVTCPVIGTTGTPHDAKMRFDPTRYVKLSVWSKQDADAQDGSLKYLPDEEVVEPVLNDAGEPELDVNGEPITVSRMRAAGPEHLIVVDNLNAVVLTSDGENVVSLDAEPLPSHGAQQVPIVEVAINTARKCKQLDNLMRRLPKGFANVSKARHRGDEWTVGYCFYSHALVAVKGVSRVEEIVNQLNQEFESNRALWPLEDGWRAVGAHGGSTGKSGAEGKIQARPLTQDSPWLLSDQKYGGLKVTSKCARILVVDAMAREGVSNSTCNVVGIGMPLGSLLEPGQRLPRALGSCLGLLKKLCPPSFLDTCYFITHASWRQNPEQIEKTLRYIIKMKEYLSNLQQVDAFMGAKPGSDEIERKKKESVVLSPEEKVELISRIAGPVAGSHIRFEEEPEIKEQVKEDVTEWISTQFGSETRKGKKAAKLLEATLESPAVSARILRADVEIPRYSEILIAEAGSRNTTIEDLFDWVDRRYPGEHTLDEIKENQAFRKFITNEFRKDHQVEIRRSEESESINRICARLGHHALDSVLSESTVGKEAASRSKWIGMACAITKNAVKAMLNVPENQKLEDGGPYDRPQAKHLVYAESDRLGWYVRNRLIKKIPDLAYLATFIAGGESAEGADFADGSAVQEAA